MESILIWFLKMLKILEDLKYSSSLRQLKSWGFFYFIFTQMCGWTVSCAITDKGLLGLIHIYSVNSLGINSFLSFQKKAINNSIWTFQISFLGIGALWLILHCKVIEIKLALEIIINLRWSKVTPCLIWGSGLTLVLVTPGVVK